MKVTAKVKETICQRIMDGESLRVICAGDDMPSRRSVFDHLAADDDFAKQYAHAREAQADAYADDIVSISDEPADTHEKIAHAKLRIDSRKWVASKLLPKKYGDATLLKHGDAEGRRLEMDESEIAVRVSSLLAQVAGRHVER